MTITLSAVTIAALCLVMFVFGFATSFVFGLFASMTDLGKLVKR